MDPALAPASPPLVSVVMANHNGAAHLQAALDAVLAQSLAGIEVLVADDGSTDGSVALVDAAADADPRIRSLPGGRNAGPAAARNRALRVARGRWIAVVDSDDLMHPRRLERLVSLAERDGADIAADDVVPFADGDGAGGPPLLGPRGLARLGEDGWVDLPAYVRSNAMFGRVPPLGYLKPVFRSAALSRLGPAPYNPSLRIAEDYDLVLRLLACGARFRVYGDAMYHYRKHAGSISHRLSRASLEAMLAADDGFRARHGGLASEARLRRALDHRRRSLRAALAFDGLVADLKAGHLGAAARTALRNPRAALLLRLPLLSRLRRFR